MRANLPVAALYKYDSSIFDGAYIKGVAKEDFIEHFLLSYGDLTPIYQSPSYFSRFVESVGNSLKWSIDHLWEITQLEYNPIENYDRQESWSDNGNGTFQKGKVTSNQTYKKGDVSTTYEKSTDSTHSVAAYNADTAQLSDKDVVSDSGSDSQTFGTDNTNGTVENGLDSSTSATTHTGRIHGNIGITTSQQMMQAEIDLSKAYNFLDEVCKLYADRLLIGVW